MKARRTAPRPYRGGVRNTATRRPARQVDLAFDPMQPRDPQGRWVSVGWRGLHRPPSRSDDPFTEGSAANVENVMPDFYEHPEYYRTGDRQADNETIAVLRSVRGKPDTEVTIYRGVPTQFADEPIRNGDWVTLSPTYAAQHVYSNLNGEGKVVRRRAKARDLLTSGDSMNEFGYVGDVALAVTGLAWDIDLANPSLGRTRRITSALLAGEDPVDLLKARNIPEPVAQAVAKIVSTGTVHRPNARRGGHPLTLPVRIERDRDALYRGAYMLKAAERIKTAVKNGTDLKDAMATERRFYAMHETARRARLESVVKAQRVAQRFGEPVKTASGNRTLIGWYLNPLLNNDPECKAADGHNFYAEEGTLIGFPGSVHLGCGCIAGPPISGAGMVDDAVRGVASIVEIPSRPKYTRKRKARMTA